MSGVSNALGVGRTNSHVTTTEFDPNQGNLGVDLGELGSSKVTQNPDGSWSKVVEQGAADSQRNQLINSMLGDINPISTAAQDAYYDSQMRMVEPQFERAQQNLDENLINRGIQVGNEQYSKAMGDLLNSQNTVRQNVADQALQAGQDFTGSQINNANQLSAGRDINTLLEHLGVNDSYVAANIADNQRNAEREAYRNQRSNNILGFLGF